MSAQRMEEDHSMIVKCHNCGKESQLEVFHKGDKVLHTTIQCSKCGETIHVLV
jgi:ribosomal protein S27E